MLAQLKNSMNGVFAELAENLVDGIISIMPVRISSNFNTEQLLCSFAKKVSKNRPDLVDSSRNSAM